MCVIMYMYKLKFSNKDLAEFTKLEVDIEQLKRLIHIKEINFAKEHEEQRANHAFMQKSNPNAVLKKQNSSLKKGISYNKKELAKLMQTLNKSAVAVKLATRKAGGRKTHLTRKSRKSRKSKF